MPASEREQDRIDPGSAVLVAQENRVEQSLGSANANVDKYAQAATGKQKLLWGLGMAIVAGGLMAAGILFTPLATWPLAIKIGAEAGAVLYGLLTGAVIRSEAPRRMRAK